MFAYVQSLIALRKEHPALRRGKQWHIGWDDGYYAFLRETAEERLLVIYNNAGTSRRLEIAIDDTPLEKARGLRGIFGGQTAEISDGKIVVTLPARTAAVFSVQ